VLQLLQRATRKHDLVAVLELGLAERGDRVAAVLLLEVGAPAAEELLREAAWGRERKER